MHLLILISAMLLATAVSTTAPATRPTPFAIELKPAGPGRVVAWSARVRSGGHALTTDRVVVDGTTIRVFATLETPAPDAMVAQAFGTLTGESAVADPAVTTAELSIRRVVRGQSAEGVAYEVVATSPSR